MNMIILVANYLLKKKIKEINGGKIVEQKDLEKIVKLILKCIEPEEATRLITELVRAVEKPPRVIYPDYPYYPYYPYNPITNPSITWQDTTKPLWDWTKVTSTTDPGAVSNFDSVRETKNK